MNDTRINAAIAAHRADPHGPVVSAEFARELARDIARLREDMEFRVRLTHELTARKDALEKQNYALREFAERLLRLHERREDYVAEQIVADVITNAARNEWDRRNPEGKP